MIDFKTIQNINVDLIVGFGNACRVAASLKRNNMRFFSHPFDWQMNYSLEDVITLLENNGATFYSKCHEDKKYASNKTTGIVDDKTGMISMHDYSLNQPIENAPVFLKRSINTNSND